jgi:hypothetical protein
VTKTCLLLAHFEALRKTNRQYLDYGSAGYVGISMKKPKSTWKPNSSSGGANKMVFQRRYDGISQTEEEKDYHYAALLPSERFLQLFGDPVAFSQRLEQGAEDVMEEWERVNRVLVPTDRTQAERYYPLHEHSFRGQRNTPEKSVYELQISTFGYTEQSRRVDYPDPIEMRDLKASQMMQLFFYFASLAFIVYICITGLD